MSRWGYIGETAGTHDVVEKPGQIVQLTWTKYGTSIVQMTDPIIRTDMTYERFIVLVDDSGIWKPGDCHLCEQVLEPDTIDVIGEACE